MGNQERGAREELADPLADSPLPTVGRWLAEARAAEGIRNHDAMALATVDESGIPQVRMVLCRGLDLVRGAFTFYTNRESPKGVQLERSGRASAVFYWDALARQLRVGGRVSRTSDRDSDEYFAGRQPLSQISAWASDQSRPIESRAALERRHEQLERRFGRPDLNDPIPRPPHWGGFEILADRIELWVEGEGRRHDRAVWTRALDAPAVGDARNPSGWRVERLQP